MTQGLLQLATTGTVSGLQNNQGANAALAALATLVQGAAAPTAGTTGLTSIAGVVWHDTANNLLKIRDQADANWLIVGQFDETNKVWIPVFNGQTLAAALAGAVPIVNAAGTGWILGGLPNGLKNRMHNGGCAVAQRSAPALSTSFQYGAVDRFMAAVTAGTVSAGAIAQNAAAPLGRSGKSLHCSAVTTTGAAVVSAKQRIESVDAVQLKNATGSFGVRVYQDTGASINYQITIRKPTAADNYAGTAQIAQSGLIAVPTATDTLITLANVALGDVSNGIEIQVDAQCGAVTTKNFHFTEWQLEEGPSATPFERRPYAQELRDCQRFLEVMNDFAFSSQAGSAGQNYSVTAPLAVAKRATPANGGFVGGTSWGLTNATSPSISATPGVVRFAFQAGGAGGVVVVMNGTGAITAGILFSAEL